MIHPVECASRLNALSNMYVRSGSVPAGADQRFYDLGNFQIATVGMQAGAVIGELWCSYNVKLLKPKLPTPLGANLLSAHIVESPVTTAAAATFFGTGGGSIRAGATLPTVVTTNTFTLPIVGRWVVAAITAGSATTNITMTGGSNIATISNLQDNGATSVGAVQTGTTLTFQVFDVNSPGTAAANVVTCTGFANLASGKTDVWITQVSSGQTLEIKETLYERLERFERMFSRLESGSFVNTASFRELQEPVTPESKEYVVAYGEEPPCRTPALRRAQGYIR